MKLNFPKHLKSKPRTPAYVNDVYRRIEVEMCTARNAVVALDMRIGHIIAKLSPEEQAEVEAALKAYNTTICTAISNAADACRRHRQRFGHLCGPESERCLRLPKGSEP